MLAWLGDLNWWAACGALVAGGMATAIVRYALNSNKTTNRK